MVEKSKRRERVGREEGKKGKREAERGGLVQEGEEMIIGGRKTNLKNGGGGRA